MEASTVTSKGTVTIPKYIRDELGIVEGNSIEFALDQISRQITLKKRPTLQEVRKMNAKYFKGKVLDLSDRDGWMAERSQQWVR
jgi:AbrB family looped-hinge helix DNA binding protein